MDLMLDVLSSSAYTPFAESDSGSGRLRTFVTLRLKTRVGDFCRSGEENHRSTWCEHWQELDMRILEYTASPAQHRILYIKYHLLLYQGIQDGLD